MSRLDQILGLCPELRIIACRLAEPDALDPTEEALDTLFSRGSRLEVVHNRDKWILGTVADSPASIPFRYPKL